MSARSFQTTTGIYYDAHDLHAKRQGPHRQRQGVLLFAFVYLAANQFPGKTVSPDLLLILAQARQRASGRRISAPQIL